MDGRIVILGAGAAGLSCAYELSRRGRASTIVEKEDGAGGLARTLRIENERGTFLTDIGPHRFFSKQRSLYDMIEGLLGRHWISVDRLTHFYVDGKLYRYPLKLGETLRNIGPSLAVRALIDFATSRAKAALSHSRPRNFEEYAIANFGATLARFNLLNYTEKIWGVPCSEISPDWATQRITGLSVRALVKNALTRSKGPKTLVDRFQYPDTGAGLLYETMLGAARKAGSRILTGTRPVRVRHESGRIREIELSDGTSMEPELAVSSIPITELATLLDPPPPSKVIDAARRLRFRAQMHLFIMLDRERVGMDQWYYYPEARIPFGRISEMKNFSELMCPEGTTSLTVEYFVFKDDATWRMGEGKLTDLTIDWMKRVGLDDGRGIIGTHIHREEHAYPIYELGYRRHLNVLKEWLAGLGNLITIGRPGRFRYTNQDHSIEMGLRAARSLIEGRRYDIEGVGSETEYYEKGPAGDA